MFPQDGLLRCRNERCGFKMTPEGIPKVTIEMVEDEREFGIFDKDLQTVPTTRVECPKCGHTTAYWHLRQTRAADEPPTRIYRCTKCGATWREY